MMYWVVGLAGYWVVGLAGKRSRSEVFTRTVQAEEDDVAQEKDDDELYNKMWQLMQRVSSEVDDTVGGCEFVALDLDRTDG